MATFTSTNFDKDQPLAPHSAGEVYVSDDIVSLPVTLAADDIFKVGYLPVGCVPLDMMVVTEELDTNATDTLRIDIGLLDDIGTGIASGTEMMSDLQCEAAKVARANGTDLLSIAPHKTADRVIVGKVTAAGATKAAGDIRVILTYRASNHGI